MIIKVKHKISKEVMYAISFTDSGYVVCVDYNGEISMYSNENITVIDPEYLPNKDKSDKVIHPIPKMYLKL